MGMNGKVGRVRLFRAAARGGGEMKCADFAGAMLPWHIHSLNTESCV